MPDECRVYKLSLLSISQPVKIYQPEKQGTCYFNWNIDLTFEILC